MIKKFAQSFIYAFQGLALGIREEKNLRFDIVCMVAVLRLSFFYGFDRYRWTSVIILVFLIPALELMNTAVERAVYKPDESHYLRAGKAKDTAAAAVLVMAAGSVVSAVMLFWQPPVIKEIFAYYFSDIYRIAGLGAFAVAAYIFIRFYGKGSKENKKSNE